MNTRIKSTGTRKPADSTQDPMQVLAAAQQIRSEAVAKYLSSATRKLSKGLGPLFGGIRGAIARRREAAELLNLSDHSLADIGLTRADVYAARRNRQPVGVAANDEITRNVA